MELKVVDIEGKSQGKLNLTVEVNKEAHEKSHVLYLVNNFQQTSLRQGSASTKGKGEVSGGGAKPYRQKGTGNARRGSTRTPLRPGGGVAFGPKPHEYSLDLNKSVIKLGFQIALSEQVDQTLVLQETSHFLKTKAFQSFLNTQKISGKEKVLLVTSDTDDSIATAAQNLGNVEVVSVRFIPISNLLGAKHVVLTSSSAQALQEWFENE